MSEAYLEYLERLRRENPEWDAAHEERERARAMRPLDTPATEERWWLTSLYHRWFVDPILDWLGLPDFEMQNREVARLEAERAEAERRADYERRRAAVRERLACHLGAIQDVTEALERADLTLAEATLTAQVAIKVKAELLGCLPASTYSTAKTGNIPDEAQERAQALLRRTMRETREPLAVGERDYEAEEEMERFAEIREARRMAQGKPAREPRADG